MFHLLQIIFAAWIVLGTALAAGGLVYPRVALPFCVRLAAGTVLCSAVIFLWLLNGYATPVTLGTSAMVLIAGGVLVRPARAPWLPRMNWWLLAPLVLFGLTYGVYVAAPEIGPDSVTYHLGLVREYVRLEGFPERIGFYEMLPQGFDMLFVPAYMLAKHGGAKAVHFGFLLALVPLFRHLGRALGLRPMQADGAAVVLFLAPVLGVAGTSAYSDAAVLLFAGVAWLLLLEWRKERRTAYLVHAALAAGFCYAVKPTFGLVALLGFAYVIWRAREWKAVSLFAGLALLAVSPWVLRAVGETGNPVAPFFNHWFPNDVFREDMDRNLAAAYSALRPGFSWLSAPLDYAILGGNQGVLGLPFLLVPLAFFRKSSRWMLGLALLLLLPWFMNTGTRFLLPAAAVGLVALLRLLPDKAVVAVVLLQAVTCFPPVLDLLEDKFDWKLEEIPFAAAAGVESERDYLLRNVENYGATELVQQFVPKGAGVLALAPVQEAYLDSPVLVFWQSALAQNLTDRLRAASEGEGERAPAVAAVRKAGYRYLLITTGHDPFGRVGLDMLQKQKEWHLNLLGSAGNVVLFWIGK